MNCMRGIAALGSLGEVFWVAFPSPLTLGFFGAFFIATVFEPVGFGLLVAGAFRFRLLGFLASLASEACTLPSETGGSGAAGTYLLS